MNKFLFFTIVLVVFISNTNAGLLQSQQSFDDSLYIRSLDYYDESEDSSTIIEITYPKLFGLKNKTIEDKINSFLEEEFFKSLEFFEEFVAMLDSFPTVDYEYGMYFSFETGFDIKLLNETFLSLLLNHYEFTGGAHGNFYSMGYNFDMRTGEILRLDNVVDPNSLPEISKLCEEKILEQSEAEILTEAGLFEDYLELSLEQDFYLLQDALVFQFDPYEIAPFSMGNIEVVLDYDDIKNYIILKGLISE